MIPWLKRLLFDEAAAQRYSAVALLFVGSVLTHGGAIPGTGVVIPGLAPYSGLGQPLQMLAIYISGGSKFPGAKGNGMSPSIVVTPPKA